MFLRAVEVALDFHEDVGAAEDAHETIEDAPRTVAIPCAHARRQRATRTAGETHESRRRGFEILERDRRLALRRTELGPRDQPTEVLPALAILDEHRQPRAARERQLAAHQGSDARVHSRTVKPRRAIHTVAIDQRERRHATPRRLRHECFRMIRALEKRKRRLRMQLHKHHAPPVICTGLHQCGVIEERPGSPGA